ncbi:hypothetical protein HDU86_002172 [Geranomyces michiganensis]|nr:hypothetical protein HDU86_002172 [Geranomyces michiganensis]
MLLLLLLLRRSLSLSLIPPQTTTTTTLVAAAAAAKRTPAHPALPSASLASPDRFVSTSSSSSPSASPQRLLLAQWDHTTSLLTPQHSPRALLSQASDLLHELALLQLPLGKGGDSLPPLLLLDPAKLGLIIKQLYRSGRFELATRALDDAIALRVDVAARTYHYVIAAHLRQIRIASRTTSLATSGPTSEARRQSVPSGLLPSGQLPSGQLPSGQLPPARQSALVDSNPSLSVVVGHCALVESNPSLLVLLDTALHYYAQMRRAGLVPPARTFRILFHFLCHHTNRLTDMHHLYADMHIMNITPDAHIFHSFISACEKAGAFRTAWGQFVDSLDTAIQLRQETYWSLVRMCVRARDMDGCKKVLGVARSTFGYVMDADTAAFVVDALLRVDDLRGAFVELEQMVNSADGGGGINVSLVAFNAFLRQAMRHRCNDDDVEGPAPRLAVDARNDNVEGSPARLAVDARNDNVDEGPAQLAVDAYRLLPAATARALDPAVLYVLLPHLVKHHPRHADAALNVFFTHLVDRARLPAYSVAQAFLDALMHHASTEKSAGAVTAACRVIKKLHALNHPIRNTQLNALVTLAINIMHTNNNDDSENYNLLSTTTATDLILTCCNATTQPLNLDTYTLYLHTMLRRRPVIETANNISHVLDVHHHLHGIAQDNNDDNTQQHAPSTTSGGGGGGGKTHIARVSRLTFAAIADVLDNDSNGTTTAATGRKKNAQQKQKRRRPPPDMRLYTLLVWINGVLLGPRGVAVDLARDVGIKARFARVLDVRKEQVREFWARRVGYWVSRAAAGGGEAAAAQDRAVGVLREMMRECRRSPPALSTSVSSAAAAARDDDDAAAAARDLFFLVAPVMRVLLAAGRGVEALELRREMMMIVGAKDCVETLRVAFRVWLDDEKKNAAAAADNTTGGCFLDEAFAAIRNADADVFLERSDNDNDDEAGDFFGRLAGAFARRERYNDAAAVIAESKTRLGERRASTWRLVDAEMRVLVARGMADDALTRFCRFYHHTTLKSDSQRRRGPPPAITPDVMCSLIRVALKNDETTHEQATTMWQGEMPQQQHPTAAAATVTTLVAAICANPHHYPAEFYRSCVALLLEAPSPAYTLAAARLQAATAAAGYTHHRDATTALLRRFEQIGDPHGAWALFRGVYVDYAEPLVDSESVFPTTTTVSDTHATEQETEQQHQHSHLELVRKALSSSSASQDVGAIHTEIAKWKNFEDLPPPPPAHDDDKKKTDFSSLSRPGCIRRLPAIPHISSATITTSALPLHLVTTPQHLLAPDHKQQVLTATRVAMTLLSQSLTTRVPADVLPGIILANLATRQVVVRACVESLLRLPGVGDRWVWFVVDALAVKRGGGHGNSAGFEIEMMAQHVAKNANGARVLREWVSRWSDGGRVGCGKLMALWKGCSSSSAAVDEEDHLRDALARAVVRTCVAETVGRRRSLADRVYWLRARGFQFTHETHFLALLSAWRDHRLGSDNRGGGGGGDRTVTVLQHAVDAFDAATTTTCNSADDEDDRPTNGVFKPTAATLAALLTLAKPLSRGQDDDITLARALWTRLVRTYSAVPDEACFRLLVELMTVRARRLPFGQRRDEMELEAENMIEAARRRGFFGGEIECK